MPDRESVLTLDEVYRPLTDKSWFLQADVAMREDYPEAATLVGPTALAYHVMNIFEMGRVPPMGLEQAKSIKSALDELRTDKGEDVDVRTTRVVAKKGIIKLGLEENEVLVSERKFMLDAIHRIFDVKIPYSRYHNLHIGRVFDHTKEGKIRHFLTDNFMPTSVSLGGLTAKAMLNGEEAFLL